MGRYTRAKILTKIDPNGTRGIRYSLPQDTYYLPLGIQIRIPTNIGAIQSAYNKLNRF